MSKKNLYITLGTIIVLGLAIYFIINPLTYETDQLDLGKTCTANGGNWLESPQECEGISNEICEEMGGVLNECASACRNDPGAEICTMQCVLVCEF